MPRYKPTIARSYRWIALSVICGLLSLGIPVSGQESTARDPIELARRLLGIQTRVVIVDPAPLYQPGQQLEFWVNQKSSDLPAKVGATLVVSAPNLDVWVADDLDFDPAAMEQLTAQLAGILDAIRRTSNLGPVEGFEPLLAVPDVDSNGRLSVLYAKDVSDQRDAFYNPNNSLPAVFAPGRFSNQKDLIVVNTSKYPSVTLDNPLYVGILSQVFFDLIADYYTPEQAHWLTAALRNWYFTSQLQLTEPPTDAIAEFLEAPSVPLIAPPTTPQIAGAQHLFLNYLQQRLGAEVFAELFRESGEGLAALDTILERHGLADPVTEQPLTGRAMFADFVMANILNIPTGDARYAHTSADLQRGQAATALSIGDVTSLGEDLISLNSSLIEQTGSGLTVNQFGSIYVHMTTSIPLVVQLGFSGADSVSRLPMPGDNRLNHFYWSGRGQDRDHMLTRAFDLSGADRATLTFDAWYELADNWNYAYVEVSADGGHTWEILPATTTTPANPNALAYGPGFTGISNPDKPRAFPYLGITFDPATGQINDIVPDGPVAQTEAQIGDLIIGHDGELWPDGVVDLVGLLADYNPGDTVNLYLQQDERRFDLPVVLGEHPVRRFVPEPLWMPQEVDLSAYSGEQVLVRFEYISLPDQGNNGIAIDNLAIREIGYSDDVESETTDWTLIGWQRVNNEVPQRYLLQSALLDADGFPLNVRALVGPEDNATAGEWRFKLEADQGLIVAVSGLNENTAAPAPFDLLISAGRS